MKKLNLTGLILIFIVSFFACNKADNISPVPAAHTIQNFFPLKDSIGGQLTINGTNFSLTVSNNIVKVNGILATVLSATESKLIVLIPNGLSGDCSLSVTISNITVTATTNLKIVSPIELLIPGKWKYAKSIRVDSSFIYNGTTPIYLPWPFMTPLNNTFYNLDSNRNYLLFSDNSIAYSFQEAWGLGQAGLQYKDTIPYSINNNQVYLSFVAGTNQISNPAFDYAAYNDTITIQSISSNKMVITRSYHDKHYGHANTVNHRKQSIDSLMR